jgi:ElaB/YqjD/DUF883 family membrane-anchored ribosome-binding protein
MTSRSPAQIELEAEASRARITDLLEELRERISPGVIVDQVLGYTDDGAGKEFVQTLGDQARRNPLACAIIGAGVAWLMLSDRRVQNGGSGYAMSNGAMPNGNGTHAGNGMLKAAGDAVDTVFDKASSAASSVGNAASSGYASTSDATRRFADQVKSTVVSLEDKAIDMARQGRDRIATAGVAAGTKSWDLLTDQPLVTAGIGLAVGAALGAMLPSTETEDELMGAYSDELKEQAQEVAGEQFDKVKLAAEEAASATKEGMQKMTSEMLDTGDDGHAEDDDLARQAIKQEDATKRLAF